MCGIAGLVAFDSSLGVEPPTLERMSRAIAHRGPDGAGIWIAAQSYPSAPEIVAASVGLSRAPFAALVHRRLAVIDPDARANQPFVDQRGRAIVFNGEIYNHRELRTELDRLDPNIHWRTRCDTEVLLAAYAQWGAACVDHLNGMFAFAVYDPNERSLFLARDRIGQKPLFYCAIANVGPAQPSGNSPMRAVAFASELPALRQIDWIPTSIDPTSLNLYLRYGFIPGPATIHPGVFELPPGHRLFVTPSRSTLDRYWSPPDPTNLSEPIAVADAVRQTRSLVIQAVGRQLIADVPLGCFLSGGIDSSIIVAAMRHAGRSAAAIHTFSIGFEDRRYDESHYAAEVAAHLGTQHHAFTVRLDAPADLPALAAALGQPFADSSALPTFYLSRQTREHVTVALSGDGGDELFGGYDRYRAIRLSALLRSIGGPAFCNAAAKLARHFPAAHPKSRMSRLQRLLQSLDQQTARRYSGYLRLFDDGLAESLLGGGRPGPTIDTSDPMLETFAKWAEDCPESPDRVAMAIDRRFYLPDDILTKVDRTSMQFALEVRSPFLDHDLVRFAGRLTRQQLFAGGGKRMLREAFSGDLPASVFNRPKMGFAVPIGQWLRTTLRPLLNDALLASDSCCRTRFNIAEVEKLIEDHHLARCDHSHRLYALLMLELWERSSRRSA